MEVRRGCAWLHSPGPPFQTDATSLVSLAPLALPSTVHWLYAPLAGTPVDAMGFCNTVSSKIGSFSMLGRGGKQWFGVQCFGSDQGWSKGEQSKLLKVACFSRTSRLPRTLPLFYFRRGRRAYCAP